MVLKIGVAEFPTKTAEKEEGKNGSELFFQKWVRNCAVRIHVKFHFWREKTKFRGGGGITSKLASHLASIHPGAYTTIQAYPNRFLAKDVSSIEKMVAK